ncbi:universal stress protein [Cryptosporangium arvum]|uniref:universal stress protein n=1 Tax=Cryptosporangium arvum TaxID=80871 RepID=UPI00316AE6A3
MTSVVVGTDGSGQTDGAVDRAAAEAARRGHELRIVHGSAGRCCASRPRPCRASNGPGRRRPPGGCRPLRPPGRR